MTLTMIMLAGLLGASGIVLAAAAAHVAPGTGLEGAAYMLLFHATALLSGTALLQQGVLPLLPMLAVLIAWVLGAALFSGDTHCALSPAIAFLQWRRRPEALS